MRSAWSSFQGPWTRLYVVLSLVSLALASIPVWWVLTTIVRLELPVRQVHEWEAQAACPVHAPVRIGLDLRDADWIDAAALRRRTEAKLAVFARGPQLCDHCAACPVPWAAERRCTGAGAEPAHVRRGLPRDPVCTQGPGRV